MRVRSIALLSSFLVLAALGKTFAGPEQKSTLEGRWELVPQASSEVPLYRNLSLEFRLGKRKVVLVEKWGRRRSFSDTLVLRTDGTLQRISVTNRVWPTNVFMGLSMIPGSSRQVKAAWVDPGKTLRLDIRYPIRGSQGKTWIEATHWFKLQPDPDVLEYTIHRDTRVGGPVLRYVLKRAGTKRAFVMHLKDDWRIDGGLPENAFLISLQGIANCHGPKLYFVYPKSWAFTYTPHVFDFYKNKRYYTFTELKTPQQALDSLKQYVKGYVVWDKKVRTSLIVAFTVAGLEHAAVVSEDLIPLVQAAGLKPVEDFRGKFEGKTDAEIYQWAYDRYWDRCSRDFIVWLGGEWKGVMKPGVADWGIYKKVFFNDLSARPSDKEEYALANKILSQMKPFSMVMGWHSYKKDLEREWVTLTSHYGLRVEGLHTLPNLSFSSQIPLSPGFKFRNHHNVKPGQKLVPDKKVYITCVQSDGIGLGAWTKPGRGEIPYAWEVTMNYYWMAPAMLEFFYTEATPNDYFIGALSGPGYMYPKAVPKKYLGKLLDIAYDLMQKLDLQVFEIMDYSEGATVEGNTELTREVVDAYYKHMPGAIGFINGYAPAFTFAIRDGKPLISYDYYLSPTRPVDDAVADIYELASINKKRPYFLLFHVRESSDIKRVKSILDKLGPEFELVPLDVFLKMAGSEPTFEERFLEKARR